jgi:predicted transcriptional regulator
MEVAAAMTLTVRLDNTLETALERYCLERGVTKSLVVQECLAQYLLLGQAEAAGSAPTGAKRAAPRVSANYKAFADAGLIGAGASGGPSATKAVVRERAMKRISRNWK